MSLTELSYWFRKFLPFGVLFCLISLIIFYSFKLYFIYLEANKPVILYTDPIFGKIDRPVIPHATASGGLQFVLDTVEGTPVTATEAAKVYFMPNATTKFGYREKIYLIAKSFGFDTNKIKHKLTDKIAEFDAEGKKLTIDVSNFNFKYESDIKTNTFITGSVNISKKEIENKAINFLKLIGRYPEELSKAIATPKFFSSQNYVIMTFNGSEPKVIRAQISFFEKSDAQFGVYPLKTGDEAWAELQKGGGMIIAGQEHIKKVTIKKMGLYYLDPDVYQTYLQPVYVFIGDDDFVAYVPAIKNDFLTE
ncbi:MAG: hypothetical protein UR68_C0003G0013 [Candidatus Roizmanbacteria bacterium GW2011_GWA2_35_19]|uniref:Uncharacterized protein n=1 Tax=Candidatus Roizmanbacteria bacterium GW2011_GWA2_35_19 TaxID=1618478 RepID=A0A0G0BWU9_9BACT|nr:MAG: hypothetical protein UR68_C0003G0013 [Candidatus Roizmanbacteria bacterium GW2011_GWA2_35_19]